MLVARRSFLGGAGTLLAGASPSLDGATLAERFRAIERQAGGRIGVAALNTATGARLSYRDGERFAMASTFKWLLAACVLWNVDRGKIALGQPIRYGTRDLLGHSPVTAAHLSAGSLSVEALAAAAVEESDNGAANLLLKLCGGPAGLTQFLRSAGDRTTRLDRTEPDLNSNGPGDPRDTTTPSAMLATMRVILLQDALTPRSRARLISWLKACTTGADRLRAGLPRGWVAGDKTGTGENGAVNDIAIAWPPRTRSQVLIAAYMSGSKAPTAVLGAAHAHIASLIVSTVA